MNPEELVAVTHELGHAVHILCHTGSPQEFDDLPLDVLELRGAQSPSSIQ